MKTWIAQHKVVTGLAAVAVLAVGAWLVFYFFGFQTLLFDREVNEALPSSAPVAQSQDTSGDAEGAGSPDAAVEPEPQLQTLSKGRFEDIEYQTTGSAAVIELPDGTTVLRFEDLDTQNGPDLKVYLSEAPADADPSTHDDNFVDLGALKGNKGDQNYDVPANVNLSKIQSVVVWCKRFSVGFGVAPLDPV